MKSEIEINYQNAKKFLELRNYVALLDRNDVA